MINVKKMRKSIIAVLFVIVMLFTATNTYANDVAKYLKPVEFTDEFKEWLESEDKTGLQPRPIEIVNTKYNPKNPLYLVNLKTSSAASYTLKTVIPENVIVKDQMSTSACWTFGSLSSLETNLALRDYYNGIAAKTYDFSEEHMEYATTRTFAGGAINKYGLNREVKESGGNFYIASGYLTNGMGAVLESDMPFDEDKSLINISEIDKNVVTQVYDTKEFPSYSSSEATSEVKQQIKEHIVKYGSVESSIHGASFGLECYNNSTAALYCEDGEECKTDHAISIVGWDDNFARTNFGYVDEETGTEYNRPINKGAWIIKNSWGEEIEYDLAELKQDYFEAYEDFFAQYGINDAASIPDSFITELGYIIEGSKAIMPVGDNGFMYVSYEDVNIYSAMNGIIKADDDIDYENIYQYNETFSFPVLTMTTQKIYLSNIFAKQTQGTEYLTQIGIYAPETYTCKVYVNPNGTGTTIEDLGEAVELVAGTTETFDAGYHTLEFLNPIEITGNNFAVVVEVQGTRTSEIDIGGEIIIPGTSSFYDKVELESGKCFIATNLVSETSTQQDNWIDLSTVSEINSSLYDMDSTIKAFTTSTIIDDSLNNIEITTPPDKTDYFEGDNFEAEGMVVTASYNNGDTNVIIGYDITNGTNLQEGQTSVTISYQGKTVNQPITVEKNTVIGLTITSQPTKTVYKAGEHFEKAGMTVNAEYKDGTTVEVTDYTIKDGLNLKNGQTTVTICYEEFEVTQAITVEPNPVSKIEVTKAPDKVNYIVGQDFDKTGMIVKATYEDGTEINLDDYIIEGGENLTAEQTTITIKFEDKTTTQGITVVEKSVESISVSKMPNKTTYMKNREQLNLEGGIITAKYNDGEEEQVAMTSEDVTVTGFNNTEKGEITLTVTYKTKSTTFKVEIIAEEIKNSDFNNAKCAVKSAKGYFYTDPDKKEYIVMDVEINSVVKNSENDDYEYYYYLSANQQEENIANWVKIQEEQTANNKLNFTINTKDISNYDELITSPVLYIYIKEVAIKGGDQKAAMSKSMLVEISEDTPVETYVDDVKQTYEDDGDDEQEGSEDNKKPSEDNTISTGKIPNAGLRIVVIALISATIVFSIVMFKKYRNLKDIK